MENSCGIGRRADKVHITVHGGQKSFDAKAHVDVGANASGAHDMNFRVSGRSYRCLGTQMHAGVKGAVTPHSSLSVNGDIASK